MAISIFDLFKIGIGPSSSHTVGPMKAARMFAIEASEQLDLTRLTRVKAEMFGSLGATGKGHGTPKAVILGFELETPEAVDVANIAPRVEQVIKTKQLNFAAAIKIPFDIKADLKLRKRRELGFHSNGMVFTAFADEQVLMARTYYSVGGGFVVNGAANGTANEDATGGHYITEDSAIQPYPFTTGAELQRLCDQHNKNISDLMWDNELIWLDKLDIERRIDNIWRVMQESVNQGIQNQGILPGGLKVKRRASELHRQLLSKPEAALSDPLTVIDWVTLYALAVNEENAAGGRIVTAPTNGAAGIIPAVLHYYTRFVPSANRDGIQRFLLTAAAIGILYKINASISGAEVGCQGEVGSACSMAAGALTEVLGGSPAQVQNAAEIAMEHNLGLTCDPIGGLVQVPCIERNAMAAIKAISASRMALRGDGSHFVSLDKVIKTMRDTGRDMKAKYKETSRGGLAIDVIEVPVNIVEC